MRRQMFTLFSRSLLAVFVIASALFTAPVDTTAASSNQPIAPLAPALDLVTIPAVPVGTPAPTVNGDCTQAEYANGVAYSFVDIGDTSGTVNLIHDANYLYVCMVATLGSDASRFGALYLDPQGDGATYTYANQGDYSLRVKITNSARASFRGSGVPGGWVDDSADINPTWDGAATAVKNDMVEYRLSLQAFKLNLCTLFGLAVYHQSVRSPGDDAGWPSVQWPDQPGTWQLATLGSSNCGAQGKIAYVFRGNTVDATSFYGLLTGHGYSVTLVPMSDIIATDFSQFDLILIANDTGSLDQWGTPAQVDKIANPNPGRGGVPIIGLGEGGYAFFGKLALFIGWPGGWHSPQFRVTRAGPAALPFFNGVPPGDPVPYYSSPVNSVGIYLAPEPPPHPVGLVFIGLEDPAKDHASLILQDCRMLWGNSGNPLAMTADGETIFLNSVAQMKGFQCSAPPPPPPPDCFVITKAANPPDGTPVAPGTTIQYTLTYQLKISPNCPVTTGKLVDQVPSGTVFVPGSASGGISPGADGLLTWPVAASAGTLSKSFSVVVSDAACSANQVVTNVAELRPSGVSPIPSNLVSHKVTCPPIGLPTTQPMFAEDELQIDPYPLVSNQPTTLRIQVQNLTGDPQLVAVQFQTSPDKFGIGLEYGAIGTSTITLGPFSSGELSTTYVPVVPGNQCIQAVVNAPSLAKPLVTQRCVDVTEDLVPGVTDELVIPVRNNTADAGDIILVVENTCPGWTASVDPAVLAGMGIGETRTVTLSVTPGGVLGTGCHIDLQAWINGTLIGGIRKLDVPAIHLPENVRPPWEEAEIRLNPDPPVAGVPGQLCIRLVNPLPVSRTVTVSFAVADFGAGVGFTPVASQDFNLPPNSIGTYCVSWTPDVGGTLHRCILATLSQAGYQDQHSQRNVDIVRTDPAAITGLTIPFIAGNPDLVEHMLSFQVHLVGINPMFGVMIETMMGDPAPDMIPGGRRFMLRLRFAPLMMPAGPGVSPAAPPAFTTFGSQPRLEVTQLLDGLPAGGFTVQLQTDLIYVPVIKK